MRHQKILSALLAAVCLLGCAAFPMPAAAEPFFPAANTYTPGQFSDVGLSAWYTPYVARAYELGLMQGNPSGAFCPGGSVTIAETITLAARLHKLYRGGDGTFPDSEPWYWSYVEYAAENGLLLTEYADYNAPALRREFAAILARALPVDALEEVSPLEDGAIPDVAMGDESAPEIYRLYRAGVLLGNDARGTFAPDTQIRRSEVAAIAVRLADPELRQQSFSPVLRESEPVDDDYFADAAMLGNSLVDGMWLYAGMKRMSFYGGTSLTVYNNRLKELLQKQYGKVYIQFGINELGGSTEDFIRNYRRIVTSIREVMPDAEIYIMAITPVTKAKDKAGMFTMKKIGQFNDALFQLAKEEECRYMDTCGLLCDASGYLPEKYGGWDGSPHLSESGYRAWAEIIRTYYVH